MISCLDPLRVACAVLVLSLPALGCATAPARPPLTAPELDHAAAVRLLVDRVSADRIRAGLAPVTWDAAAAAAAQAHANDMASGGFAAHLGSDGSVPEERATRAGVAHAVMENVGCVADGRARALETAPRFTRGEVDAMHDAFMNETPPFDGHRRNVLGPWHGAIGVGLARAAGVARPCIAVLLVARDGKLDRLPREAALGDVIPVSGVVAPPNVAAYVSVARLPPRARPTAAELNRTGAYVPPQPHAAVATQPDPSAPGAFTAWVTLDDQRLAGTYAIGVWARLVGVAQPVLIGMQTIVVR